MHYIGGWGPDGPGPSCPDTDSTALSAFDGFKLSIGGRHLAQATLSGWSKVDDRVGVVRST